MKQYDKVWVPEKIGHITGQMHFRDVDGDTPVLKKENVIVLTIEELREIFHEGHRTGIGRTISQPVDNPVLEKALNNYLTSKGIKLPDNG